ncbi:hypothetical protein SB912_34270, partial [Pantoea sp. SIMBA_072]
GDLVKIIAFALLLPVVVGLVVSWWMTSTDVTAATVEQYYAALPDFHAGWYLFGIFVGALVCTAVTVVLLKRRLAHANP